MCIYEKWTKFLDPFNIVSTNLNSIPHYFYVNQFNLKHSFEKIEKRSEDFDFSDHCFPKVWVQKTYVLFLKIKQFLDFCHFVWKHRKQFVQIFSERKTKYEYDFEEYMISFIQTEISTFLDKIQFFSKYMGLFVCHYESFLEYHSEKKRFDFFEKKLRSVRTDFIWLSKGIPFIKYIEIFELGNGKNITSVDLRKYISDFM